MGLLRATAAAAVTAAAAAATAAAAAAAATIHYSKDQDLFCEREEARCIHAR